MKQHRFTSHDGNLVELYLWDEVQNPKAVVKIAHGMAEHSARYDHFAQFLNSRGYIVVMNDHRGHGRTAQRDSLGYEQGDMWTNNVWDQLTIIDYCKTQYGLPVFLMGHSYGSFITQAVVQHNPDVAGYVICGSSYMKDISYTACKVIARAMCRSKGGRHPAQLIVNLSFKAYEKKFPGENAWLNRDEAEVAKYNADPMCGYVCSANFYRSFMEGLVPLYKTKANANVDLSKPILLIAGANDPVGNYGKGVKKLHKFYSQKLGVKDLEMQLYDDARHEILNGPDRDTVYDDVASWLDIRLG